MSSLGAREWISLLLFAAALVIAGSFYLPGSDNPPEPRAVSLGEVPASTADGAVAFTQPERWALRYRDADGRVVRQEDISPLDIAFDAAPFESLSDGAWSLRAEGRAEAAEGDHTFEVEFMGTIRIAVDGREMYSGESVGSPSIAEVSFTRRNDGEARIVIEATDGEGPLLVRWLPGAE